MQDFLLTALCEWEWPDGLTPRELSDVVREHVWDGRMAEPDRPIRTAGRDIGPGEGTDWQCDYTREGLEAGLRRLEQKGWARRERGPKGRPKWAWFATPAGEAALEGHIGYELKRRDD